MVCGLGLGLRCVVHGSGLDLWCVVFGLGLGLWCVCVCVRFTEWYMVSVLNLVYGVWCMVYLKGFWYVLMVLCVLVPGVC